MACAGEFGADRPSVAVFADTGWEPSAVYRWLDEIEQYGGSTIPIIRVSKGNIREDALGGSELTGPQRRFASIPAFTKRATGEVGRLRRQCTREYKVEPVTRAIRRDVLGLAHRQRRARDTRVDLWLGISTDEASRMKKNRIKYITNRYPLIDRDLSRKDCQAWLEARGFMDVPKSACIGCPYTDNARWAEMKAERPREFLDAVTFDYGIRHGIKGVLSEAFLHRSCLPLADVVLPPHLGAGDGSEFEEECEGMCGL